MDCIWQISIYIEHMHVPPSEKSGCKHAHHMYLHNRAALGKREEKKRKKWSHKLYLVFVWRISINKYIL